MKPRITIAINERGILELCLNEAGRDLLVRQLNLLSKDSTHFHLQPEGQFDEVPLQVKPYHEGDQVIEYGKLIFRPDDWDAEHYPHVL